MTTTINDVVNGKHTFPEALGKLKSLTSSVSTKTVDDVEYVFLTISGTVTYASKTCTISADLKRLVTESNKNWTLIKYYEGSKNSNYHIIFKQVRIHMILLIQFSLILRMVIKRQCKKSIRNMV